MGGLVVFFSTSDERRGREGVQGEGFTIKGKKENNKMHRRGSPIGKVKRGIRRKREEKAKKRVMSWV